MQPSTPRQRTRSNSVFNIENTGKQNIQLTGELKKLGEGNGKFNKKYVMLRYIQRERNEGTVFVCELAYYNERLEPNKPIPKERAVLEVKKVRSLLAQRAGEKFCLQVRTI